MHLLKNEKLATDPSIQKKSFGLGMILLIISNKEMDDIIKSLEESGLLIKSVSEEIKDQAREQKGEFLSMLLGTLGASLLRNLLTDKGVTGAVEGTIRASKRTIKPSQDF